MKNRFIMGLALLLIAGFWAVPALGETPWRLTKDDKGVQVYSRPVPGSDLLEFQAVTTIPADLRVMGAVLADVPNYPQWMSNCREASIIRELGNNDVLVYYVQTLPWPIANRDVVLRAMTHVDWEKGLMEVTLRAADSHDFPLDASKVRMELFKGRMRLESPDGCNTKVTFSILADPAGSLPAAGVNSGALNVPFRTLLGMKEMAGKEKYIKAAREFQEKQAKGRSGA